MLTLAAGIALCSMSIYKMYDSIEDTANKICDYKEIRSLLGDGVKCTKNVRLSVKQSNTHVLMIAPSDSGKSRRFLMHNIDLENCSIVCTDPAGEIQKTCKTDKKVYILNPFSNDTVGYDPLKNCRSEFEVRKIAKVILTNGMSSNNDKSGKNNQQEWIAMATPLLTAYMLMNYHIKRYSFYNLVKRICTLPIVPIKDKNTPSILQEIYDSNVSSAIIEMNSFLQVMGAIQTLSSIRIVMNTCLQLFLDDKVKKMLNKKNIDISKLREEESIVYIQIPEHHSDYFSPLVATFLTQMFDYMLENDGLQIYCLFDEFANCGIIPSIGKLLSTARKHKISIVAAIQSSNQLFTLYGDSLAKELRELFKTILVCGGLRDSAEYISDLLGVHEIKEKDTRKTQPLMTADEVRRLDKNRMLIICNNKRPVIDKMMDFVGS